MVNQSQHQQRTKEPKFILGSLFVDAPVVQEPEEARKIVAAGMAEANIKKEYPEGYIKKASAVCRDSFRTLIRASLWFVAASLVFILVLLVAEPFYESYVMGTGFMLTSGLGIGFNPTGITDSVGELTSKLYWEVYEPILLMLAGAAIIVSPFISGLFYCAKRSYYQDFYKKTVATYWMGFKKYWWKFLVASTVGILIATAMGTALLWHLSVDVAGGDTAGSIATVVLTFIFGAPMLLVPMIMMCLFTTYELSFKDTIKNAIVIILNNPLYVILVGIVSALPLLLLMAGQVLIIILVIVMFIIGFMFWALCWVAVADRGMSKCKAYKQYFDRKNLYKKPVKAGKCKNPYQGAKPRGSSADNGIAVETTEKAKTAKKKPQQNHYVNPKKKRRKK